MQYTALTLPLRVPTAVPSHEFLAEECTARPLRILLVEDHAGSAQAMCWLLEQDGHQVQVAGNISGGLALTTEHKFDLLISDVGLPDGSGIDLMRTLRERGSTLPGIVLSGYGHDDDVVRSRGAGFSAHLVKPLRIQILRNTIAAMNVSKAA